MPFSPLRLESTLARFATRALGWTAASAIGAAAVAAMTASRRMDPCVGAAGDLCYCEAFHDGPVLQPANTLSGLGLVAVAVAILARASDGAPGTNVFARERALRAGYGLVVLWLGLVTVGFHASYTYVAGVLDGSGMYAWITALTALNLVRLVGLARGAAAGLWLGANALALLVRVAVHNEGAAFSASTLLFGALAAVGVATTLAVPLARREVASRGAHGWLAVSLASFLGGLLVWSRSGTAGPWCAPDSALQGHAAWHLAAALSVGAHYTYLCRARDASPAPRAGAAIVAQLQDAVETVTSLAAVPTPAEAPASVRAPLSRR